MMTWYIAFSIFGVLLGALRWILSAHTALGFEEAWVFVLVTASLWAMGAAAIASWKRDPKPIFVCALLMWLFFSIGNGVGYLCLRALSA